MFTVTFKRFQGSTLKYFIIEVLGTPKCYLLLSERVHSTCFTLYSVQELGLQLFYYM